MASREDQASGVNRSEADNIHNDIIDTRRRIDGMLDELESRLAPGSIMHRAGEMISNEANRSKALHTVRQHPFSAVMSAMGLAGAATGITYLAAQSGDGRKHTGPGLKEKAGQKLHQAGDKLRHAKDAAAEKLHRSHEGQEGSGPPHIYVAGEAGGEPQWAYEGQEEPGRMEEMRQRAGEKYAQASESAREKAMAARDKLWEKFGDHPLTAGAVAMAAGMLLGELLPHTKAEDELMGPSKDKLADQAKAAGHDLKQRASRTAEAAMEAAEQEADRQEGGEASLADKAKAVVEKATEAGKEKAHEEGLDKEGLKREAQNRDRPAA
jgi:ElaB/YqjD/DUF883 family membrane-anchored ribosome-binding protein